MNKLKNLKKMLLAWITVGAVFNVVSIFLVCVIFRGLYSFEPTYIFRVSFVSPGAPSNKYQIVAIL